MHYNRKIDLSTTSCFDCGVQWKGWTPLDTIHCKKKWRVFQT